MPDFDFSTASSLFGAIFSIGGILILAGGGAGFAVFAFILAAVGLGVGAWWMLATLGVYWTVGCLLGYAMASVITYTVAERLQPPGDDKLPAIGWGLAWPVYWLIFLCQEIGYRIHSTLFGNRS